MRAFRAPFLAYGLYQKVHSTRVWSGKRPLIVLRGHTLSARVAAYAGRWGGGDIVMRRDSDTQPLGPTRFILLPDGSLELR
jgi:hypothetical protein